MQKALLYLIIIILIDLQAISCQTNTAGPVDSVVQTPVDSSQYERSTFDTLNDEDFDTVNDNRIRIAINTQRELTDTPKTGELYMNRRTVSDEKKRIDLKDYSLLKMPNDFGEMNFERSKGSGGMGVMSFPSFNVSSARGIQTNFSYENLDITLDPESGIRVDHSNPRIIYTWGHVYIGLPTDTSTRIVKSGSMTIILHPSSALIVYNYLDGYESAELSKGEATVFIEGKIAFGPLTLKTGVRMLLDEKHDLCPVRTDADSSTITSWRQGELLYSHMEVPRFIQIFNKWTQGKINLIGTNVPQYVTMKIKRQGSLKDYIPLLLAAGLNCSVTPDTTPAAKRVLQP